MTATGCFVDRVWPRGVAKDQGRIDEWAREVAPSTELRRWFGHDPDRWEEFRNRYRQELVDTASQIDRLLERARRGRVTLVYGARDEKRNNAVVLREYLEERLDQQRPLELQGPLAGETRRP